MKKGKLILLLALVACMAAGCAYLPLLTMTPEPSANPDTNVVESGDTVTISRELYEQYQKLDSLLEMMDVVDAYYYQDANEQDMLDGAASGLLYGLGDPYTFYYTAEDYAELWEEDEGNYAGVGIQISGSYLTGDCTISRVFDNSPAPGSRHS